MNTFLRLEKEKKIFYIIVILAFAIRLILALLPLPWLLERGIIADDAFYYFTIARNVVEDGIVSFDGIQPTNGFHPLWLIVLLPVFSIFSNAVISIHASLVLSAIIGAGGVILLYKVLKELDISGAVSLLGATMYAFSPALLFSAGGTMNGMETSLNVLMLLGYALVFVRIQKDAIFSWESFLVLGVLGGASFLARTDNAIFLVFTFGWIFARFLFKKQYKNISKLIVAGILVCLVAAPWLVWSYLTFGEVLQVSAKAMPFVVHDDPIVKTWGVVDYGFQFLRNIADSLIYLWGIFVYSKKSPLYLIGGILFFIFLPYFFWLFFGSKREMVAQKEAKKKLFILTPFLVAIPLFLLAQTIRAINIRAWYHLSIYPFLLMLVMVLIDFSVSVFSKKEMRFWKIAAIGFAALMIFSVFRPIISPEGYGELGKYIMVQHMNDELPEGARVGVWNAGTYGYFFEKGTILNLDGVVNNEVYPYIRGRVVGDYARAANIRYIADDESALKTMHWGKNLPIDEIKILKSIETKDGKLLLGELIYE